MKKRNKMYEAPRLEVAEMRVECGIAASLYGTEGEAGQDSNYIIDEGSEDGSFWL